MNREERTMDTLNETCERCEAWLAARLAGEPGADAGAEPDVEEHARRCPRCAAAAREMERVWVALGSLEASPPGPSVRARFEGWLAHELETEARGAAPAISVERRAAGARGRFTVPGWFALPLAATLALGVGVGYALRGAGGPPGPRVATDSAPGSNPRDPRAPGVPGDHQEAGEVAALREEVGALHRLVALSLLDRPAATQRLAGIGIARGGEVAARDDEVVAALIEAVRTDGNVNVRLAAIDALAPVVARPAVGDALLAAAADSGSPLVQASAARSVMAARPDAGPALRRWLADRGDSVDPAVRAWLAGRLAAA